MELRSNVLLNQRLERHFLSATISSSVLTKRLSLILLVHQFNKMIPRVTGHGLVHWVNLYFWMRLKLGLGRRETMDIWVRIQKKRVGVMIISLSLLLFPSSFVYGQWDLVNPPSSL